MGRAGQKVFCVAAAVVAIFSSEVNTARGDGLDDAFAGFKTASSETLGGMRGGFVGSAGGHPLNLAFGIDQAVVINDQLMVTTRLTVPNINRLSDAQLQRFISTVSATGPAAVASAQPPRPTTQTVMVQQTGSPVVPVQVSTLQLNQMNVQAFQHENGQLNLVQVGSGNVFALTLSQLPTGVLNVVQNSLDNQVIRQVTTIQMGVNAVTLARLMEAGAMIQQQLTRALR